MKEEQKTKTNRIMTMADASFSFLHKSTEGEAMLMKKYHLTPSEHLFVKILLLEDDALLYRYIGDGLFNEREMPFTPDQVNYLYSKGYVNKRWNINESEFPDRISLTPKFRKVLQSEYGFTQDIVENASKERRDKVIMKDMYTDEFIKNYPSIVKITNSSGTVDIGLKSCNKPNLGVRNRTELKDLYWKSINGDIELHKKIIEALNREVDSDGSSNNAQLKFNIVNFVHSNLWEDLLKESITKDWGDMV